MYKVLISVLVCFMIISFSSCIGFLNKNMPIDQTMQEILNGKKRKPDSTSQQTEIADQFFWGTWVRMDKGTEFIINENSVTDKSTDKQSKILSTSDKNTLYLETSLNSISSFAKKTANVIESKIGESVIPFYRKGGTNLSYSIRVVGFTDNSEANRAGSQIEGDPLTEVIPAEGITVTSTDTENVSFKDKAVTDEDGFATLTSPTQGSIQTVTVHVSDEEKIVIENLKIENDGAYMGVVPIVNDNDFVLKVSGFIAESEKTNGYLYSEKSYTMTVYITNISEISAPVSVLSITPADSSIVTIEGIDSYDGIKNPQNFTIPTLSPGATLARKIRINLQEINTPYEDTKINVRIKNLKRTWEDFIPLRIHRDTITFTIASSSPVNNSRAALNGFIIYPDGNNQYFSAPHNSSKQVIVPEFKPEDSYVFVFCGATTDGNLEQTTELYYTVSFSKYKKDFTYENENTDILKILYFGENNSTHGNETEDTAYPVTKDFEAYLAGDGDIDFYKVGIGSMTIYDIETVTVPVTL